MAYRIYEYFESDLYGEWYDFASSVSDTEDYLVLYERGCQVDGGWNCTAACLDTNLGPNLTWNTTNSTYTLHNCMVLPYIASLLAVGNLTAQAVNISNHYGIPSDATLVNNPDLGWPVINNCIKSYCDIVGTPGCDASHNTTPNLTLYTNKTTYYDSAPGMSVTLPVVCDSYHHSPKTHR